MGKRHRRPQVVVHLAHREAAGEPRAQLINLAAERDARREPELDLECRDCGKVCCSLAELCGHYDSGRCSARNAHPAGRS